ncbi:MAG TPA: ATP-binding protein [Candidatus Micrarchaeaceae archaeon]|nr:ATP-binding protein [Candidatus Micrarchaeaceae archaeon]
MKTLRFTTTRARLTALSVALLGVAALIADGGLYSVAVISGANASDAALKRQADLIGSGLRLTSQGATYLGGDLPTQADDGLATDVAVVGTFGLITGTPDMPLQAATLEALAAPVLKTRRSIWVDIADANHVQRRVYMTLVRGVDPPVALVVERSIELQNSSLGWTRLLLATLSIVFVALGGLVAYWQAGRVLRPVRDIAALAQSLSEHNLHRRVDIAVPEDELGELVKTFNAMLGRLEVSFETMSRFIADASHELRGPLTQMRTEIELAKDGPTTDVELKETLNVLEEEIAHLSEMVDKLLLLARADAGVLRPARRELDVADFIHEVAARWAAVAERAGVRLEVEAPDTGVVMADATLTRRVLDNLVENAIRHSPRQGKVWLRGKKLGESWVFEVADQGSGIPAAQRTKIFDRFIRADNARTRAGLGGTGLGLAVSLTLARVQEADLVLADGSERGAVFQLRFSAPAPLNGEQKAR